MTKIIEKIYIFFQILNIFLKRNQIKQLSETSASKNLPL